MPHKTSSNSSLLVRYAFLYFWNLLRNILAFWQKLGIIHFCAGVAERQTRRSQKPLSKDVRVQIPPPAPVKSASGMVLTMPLLFEVLLSI